MPRQFAFVALLSFAVGFGIVTQSLWCRPNAPSLRASSASPECPLRNVGLSPASVSTETVGELESQVACKQAEIDRLRREVAEVELDLKILQNETSKSPASLDRLADELTKLRERLPAARKDHAAATARLASFLAGVADRRQEIRQLAASSVAQEFEAAVKLFKDARRKREEIRANIGARPSSQDEAILENREIRRAKASAEEHYSRRVARGDATIDPEHEQFRAAVKQLLAQVQMLEAQERLTVEQLTDKQRELASAPSRIAALSEQRIRLKQELDILVQRRTSQRLALAEARSVLQRQRDEQLAGERARRREAEDASRPVAGIGPVSVVSVSSGYFPSSPSINFGSGRYYDSSYRPPVGDHSVRSYVRRDGTIVNSHRRTNPDDSFYNNWSSIGNRNPYTGRAGTQIPPMRLNSGGTSYVRGHFRSNGAHVNGYTRRSRW